MWQRVSTKAPSTRPAASASASRTLSCRAKIAASCEGGESDARHIHCPTDYHWSIHKLAKDFYTPNSARTPSVRTKRRSCSLRRTKAALMLAGVSRRYCKRLGKGRVLGFIALKTSTLLHYSYPFYKLDEETARAHSRARTRHDDQSDRWARPRTERQSLGMYTSDRSKPDGHIQAAVLRPRMV